MHARMIFHQVGAAIDDEYERPPVFRAAMNQFATLIPTYITSHYCCFQQARCGSLSD